ncbi:MAG: RrF2 family transcriptional regulator [Elusimicrobiota bacterium]
MLKLSTKSTYAIKALIYIAQQNVVTPIRLSNISDDQKIPLPFLEQIFSTLRKAGVVEAIRGPLGGYKLLKKPEEVSMGDIVTALEGPLDPIMCTHPENRAVDCHEDGHCESSQLCQNIDGAVQDILNKNTLATLLQSGNKSIFNNIPMQVQGIA